MMALPPSIEGNPFLKSKIVARVEAHKQKLLEKRDSNSIAQQIVAQQQLLVFQQLVALEYSATPQDLGDSDQDSAALLRPALWQQNGALEEGSIDSLRVKLSL